MTQEIIDMAKDANLLRTGDGFTEPHRWGISEIKAFANLVAAHEREACAKILDANAMACYTPIMRSLLQSNAQAIRARKWL